MITVWNNLESNIINFSSLYNLNSVAVQYGQLSVFFIRFVFMFYSVFSVTVIPLLFLNKLFYSIMYCEYT